MDTELKKRATEILMFKRAFQPMQGQPPPQPGAGGPPPGAGGPPPGAGGPPPGAGAPPPGAGAPPPGAPPPAGGGAPVDPQMLMQLMQDPQVQQMLQQQGIQLGPQGPTGPDGQVIPPEQIAQILEQMGVLPPAGGGAPGGAPGQDEQGMTPDAQAAGGQPPPDAGAGGPPPGAGGPPQGGTPLTVEAFMELMPQVMEQMKGGGKEGGSGSPELEARIDQLEQMITGIVQQLGMPPSSVGLGADGAGAPPPPDAGAGAPPPPEAVAADQLGAAADAVQVPPPQGMPVQASERKRYTPEIRKTASTMRIQGVISKLKHAR